MAWYNTYRPKTLDEVIGQDLVKNILKNAIEKKNIRHAYLFTGSKGVGKTTLARIFASHITQSHRLPENSIDIVEMDAASNTGIEDIRSLIESANLPPLNSPYKIYIIDEVHMLSKSAMNALLKILEEPPKYLVFLLATTNPEKIIPTVLSRLTHLRLSRHTSLDIQQRLRLIADKENLSITEESLKIIATQSEGSLRDALNLLESIASYGLDTYTEEDVTRILGSVGSDILDQIASQILHISNGDTPDWEQCINELERAGITPDEVLVAFTEFALKKSFDGDTSLSIIIPYLIELQSLRFAFGSNVSLFGLMHSYIAKNQDVPDNSRPNNVQKFVQKPQEKKKEEPESTPTLPKNQETIDDQSTPTQQSTDEVQTTTSSDSQEEKALFDAFEALLNDKSTHPFLKIMKEDIVLNSYSNSTLSISLSNPIFLAQLNTPSMTKVITDYITKITNTSIHLVIESRQNNTPQPVQSAIVDTDQHYHDDAPTSEENHKNSEDGVFYKVYRQLPEGLEEGKIPVEINEIPRPEPAHIESSQDDTSDDDWDQKSHQMFEFD